MARKELIERLDSRRSLPEIQSLRNTEKMSNAMTDNGLPSYEKAPVIETVVGVQFEPWTGFSNAHLGAFWQKIDNGAWPVVRDMPPLPRQEEQFSDDGQWGKMLRLQITQSPLARVQILNPALDRMIQLQNGRMHLNWLGEDGGQYPRYASIRKEFAGILDQLLEFADEKKLGKLSPDHWEVTYVNHIPKGTVWESPSDWSFFRPLGSAPTVEGVFQAESFSGEWHFVIPDERGRLHVHWQHAKQEKDEGAELIRLTLTARGAVSIGEDPKTGILAGIDLGRSTIVKAFQALMTDRASQAWGVEHGTGH